MSGPTIGGNSTGLPAMPAIPATQPSPKPAINLSSNDPQPTAPPPTSAAITVVQGNLGLLQAHQTQHVQSAFSLSLVPGLLGLGQAEPSAALFWTLTTNIPKIIILCRSKAYVQDSRS